MCLLHCCYLSRKGENCKQVMTYSINRDVINYLNLLNIEHKFETQKPVCCICMILSLHPCMGCDNVDMIGVTAIFYYITSRWALNLTGGKNKSVENLTFRKEMGWKHVVVLSYAALLSRVDTYYSIIDHILCVPLSSLYSFDV